MGIRGKQTRDWVPRRETLVRVLWPHTQAGRQGSSPLPSPSVWWEKQKQLALINQCGQSAAPTLWGHKGLLENETLPVLLQNFCHSLEMATGVGGVENERPHHPLEHPQRPLAHRTFPWFSGRLRRPRALGLSS